jgi:hypothetical protein
LAGGDRRGGAVTARQRHQAHEGYGCQGRSARAAW